MFSFLHDKERVQMVFHELKAAVDECKKSYKKIHTQFFASLSALSYNDPDSDERGGYGNYQDQDEMQKPL